MGVARKSENPPLPEVFQDAAYFATRPASPTGPGEAIRHPGPAGRQRRMKTGLVPGRRASVGIHCCGRTVAELRKVIHLSERIA
jgi:hypothetical protein